MEVCSKRVCVENTAFLAICAMPAEFGLILNKLTLPYATHGCLNVLRHECTLWIPLAKLRGGPPHEFKFDPLLAELPGLHGAMAHDI